MNRDNSFDKIIREKLDNVTPVAPQGDWERLLERMEHLSSSEEDDSSFFDRMVKSKAISTHDTGLNQNWVSLVSRLDRIYTREQQLLSSKILELAALLLLLIFIDRDYAPQASYFQAQNQHSDPQTTLPFQKSGFSGSPSASREERNRSDRFSNPEATPAVLLPELALVNEQNDQKTHHPDKPISIHALPLTTIAGSVKPLHQNLRLEFPATPDQKLGSSVLAINPEPSVSDNAHQGKIMRFRPGHRFSISMFGGPEVNYVHTPEAIAGATSNVDRTPVVLPALYRFAQGYSGGAALAWGKGKWELETGLIYTAKQYRARRVLYLSGSVRDGFFGEGITDIELNVAAIPVQVRYDLYRRNGWRAYSGLGGSMQLVLEANYAVAGQEAFRSDNFNPDPEAFDHSGLLKRSGLDSKTFYRGLLDGGSFSNNAFFTASASLGLERSFRSGWSLFAQPTYHHSIIYLSKGLGPDYERIHTFSLYSGVRIRL